MLEFIIFSCEKPKRAMFATFVFFSSSSVMSAPPLPLVFSSSVMSVPPLLLVFFVIVVRQHHHFPSSIILCDVYFSLACAGKFAYVTYFSRGHVVHVARYVFPCLLSNCNQLSKCRGLSPRICIC